MTSSSPLAADPKVSVFIPTRNRPELVPRAVRSALVQTYWNIEVLVVLDGPDRETQQVLDAMADSRMRVLTLEKPMGACIARNNAIASASGELITGLDDDDEFLPNHVQLLVEALTSTGSAFVATTNTIQRSYGKLVRHAFTGPITLDALLSENVVGNQVLARTHQLREVGGFDPAMPAWQDYDLWVRLVARYGSGFKIDSRTYIQHQDHDEQRISTRKGISSAHRLFTEKHGNLLTSAHLASLELLRLSTAHEPITLGQLLTFSRAGLGRRALVAYLSNRFPRLRRASLSCIHKAKALLTR